MNWDELRRKFSTRITEPDQLPLTWNEVGCTLRDGTNGSIILIKIRASRRVHSIVEDGTFVRLDKSNKELTAIEINNLMYERGVVSAESQIENIDFELLDTASVTYSTNRPKVSGSTFFGLQGVQGTARGGIVE